MSDDRPTLFDDAVIVEQPEIDHSEPTLARPALVEFLAGMFVHWTGAKKKDRAAIDRIATAALEQLDEVKRGAT